jgi:hypothetical protein
VRPRLRSGEQSTSSPAYTRGVISVALATFNGERFLGEQLRTIATQTRPPDELVACDDASTDHTVTVLERFAESAAFPVRIHRHPVRLGSVKNFESAISACAGDVIALADQDDVWHPEKLAAVESEIAHADLVFSDGKRIDPAGLPLPETLWSRFRFRESERGLVARGGAFDVLAAHNVVTGATMAFRSRWREAILPVPDHPKMHHDRWIALMVAALGTVRAIERPLIDYREHEGQQLGTGTGAGWIESARATSPEAYASWAAELRLALERLEKLHAPEAVMGRLRDRIAHLEARGSMPASRLSRIPIVAREMGRYFRYSNHVWSAAKDLFW